MGTSNDDSPDLIPSTNSSFTISALFLPNVAVFIPQLVTSLLLVEIAASFGVDVGVAGQLRTGSFITSIALALLVSALSVRFRLKSLLVAGIATMMVSALGCFLAPSFVLLLAAYALSGMSTAIMRPMTSALVGRLFSVDQRPTVLGYLSVGGSSAYLLGSVLMGVIVDWRLSFMLLVFPLALISMVLVVRGIPSFSQSTERADIVQAFMHVFRNRSALACLVGNVLAFVSWSIFLSYSASFYRQRFSLDTAFVSFAFVGTSMMYIVGGILTGRLVQRYGRKRLPVIFAVLHGLSLLGFMSVSQLWLSMVLWSVSAFSNAVRFSAYNSLVIEQVPAYQGTVMALSQVSADLGSVIGTGIGGMILLFSDYSTLAQLGLVSVVAGLVFYFFTSDPVNQS